MKKRVSILLWFIVGLTVIALLPNLPSVIPIPFETPKLPIIQRTITFKKGIPLPTLSSLLYTIGIEKDFSLRKGLDLAGGTSVTLQADMKTISPQQRQTALESVKAVIERRVNFFGVSEPVIQTATVNDTYRIIVELAGVSDSQEAVQLIGTTAELSFWEGIATESARNSATPSALPFGITTLFPNPHQTTLSGRDLRSARVTFDPNTGESQVQLTFTEEGTKKFAAITKRSVEKRVAIVLDNQILQAPTVRQEILGGDAVITGGFTVNQAKALSVQLNAGALPVPLAVLEQRSIGATLGGVSLQKSLFAGIVGFFVIVVFMVVLYGRLGIVACLALLLYALYTLTIFRMIPVTLTLAGIAGFVLSVGMAVDANILIFERMKEEMRLGKPKNVSLELGFSRAWSSIRDSNISSMITSLILIYLGTGVVRGFALTLLIGVVVSMFSAITVTKTILRIMYK